MSRSSLPQSTADRIAAVFTLATVVALVWLIAAAPQESRGAAFVAAGSASAQHVHERSDAGAPLAVTHSPAQVKAPAGAHTKSIERS